MTIYIVFGATGEYEDYNEWMFKAFKNKNDAEKIIFNFNKRLTELNTCEPLDWEARENIEEEFRKHDPRFNMDYTGSHYFIKKVELV